VSRARVLSTLLWTSVAASNACHNSDYSRDASVHPDGRNASDGGSALTDASPPDAPLPSPDATPAPKIVVPASATLQSQCGEVSGATTIVPIINLGNADLVVSAVDADSGFSATSTVGLPFTVPAGQSGEVLVTAPLAVIGTDVGGSTKPGTLTITSNAPGSPTTVALGAVVNGAQLEFVDSAGNPITTAAYDSDTVCPPDGVLYLKNVGNLSATVQSGNGSEYFQISGWDVGNTLAAGATAMATVTHEAGDGSCAGTQTLIFNVASPDTCSGSSLSIDLTFNITNLGSCAGCHP
jgi:hypothetical protein